MTVIVVEAIKEIKCTNVVKMVEDSFASINRSGSVRITKNKSWSLKPEIIAGLSAM